MIINISTNIYYVTKDYGFHHQSGPFHLQFRNVDVDVPDGFFADIPDVSVWYGEGIISFLYDDDVSQQGRMNQINNVISAVAQLLVSSSYDGAHVHRHSLLYNDYLRIIETYDIDIVDGFGRLSGHLVRVLLLRYTAIIAISFLSICLSLWVVRKRISKKGDALFSR